LFGDFLGRVVRKPVNVNPGLKVNLGNNFSSIKMLSIAYVLCSLRILVFKTEGEKIPTEHLAEKLQKRKATKILANSRLA